jgi:hypothetical protein
MTGEDNGKPVTYKLDISGAVARKIKKVIRRAYLRGSGPKVVRAWKIIIDRMRNDPLQFGELIRHHQSLNLLVHVAVVQPVAVYFGIQVENRFVIIQDVILLNLD